MVEPLPPGKFGAIVRDALMWERVRTTGYEHTGDAHR